MKTKVKAACIECKHCAWKYDMYLCMLDNMPMPVSSDSYCDQFEAVQSR